MTMERKRGPGETEQPGSTPYPVERDHDDADDFTFPFPALDPPDDWPDPEPPISIPERELA